MAVPRVMIISGNGFNCERETHYAFEMCGAQSVQVHMNDLTSGEISFSEYQILVFIGGFCYGDHLGAGKVAATKFKYRLKSELQSFINRDTLIIGICNGFQVITQLGVLPGFNNDYFSHILTLAPNTSNRYEDRWVHLAVNKNSPCIFTQDIDFLYLPVRHGEGKIHASDITVIDTIIKNNQHAVQYIDPQTKQPTDEYPYNPNGSERAIAGISDPTGRIFGIMPHPEAFLSPFNHPSWTRLKIEGNLPQEGDGVTIFRNAVRYFS